MPYDPDYANCKLLLHFNGLNNGTVFTDSSPVNRTMTRVGSTCVTSTAQSKFGGSSYYNNGSASYLTTTDNDDFDFGTDDFTVTFWVRRSAVANMCLVGRQNSNSVAPFTFNIGGSNLQIWMSLDGTTWAGGTYLLQRSLTVNVWYYLSLCRHGSNFRCFVNGVQEGSTFVSSSSFINYSKPLLIGSRTDTLHLNSYIDEVAIWRGVAKYTANFTPPTSEWTNIRPINQIISY